MNDAMASPPETSLEQRQAELVSELERTRGLDALGAAVAAAMVAGLLFFVFGRPCLRADAFLGHVWCAQVGPWAYRRLALFLVLNLTVTAPLTFTRLRGRRRRRFWAL